MRRFRVTWLEKHRTEVDARDHEDAMEKAARENMNVESCREQYAFRSEDLGLVLEDHDAWEER